VQPRCRAVTRAARCPTNRDAGCSFADADAPRVTRAARCPTNRDRGVEGAEDRGAPSQGLLDALRIETQPLGMITAQAPPRSQGLLDALRIETVEGSDPRARQDRHKGCSMPYESRPHTSASMRVTSVGHKGCSMPYESRPPDRTPSPPEGAQLSQGPLDAL